MDLIANITNSAAQSESGKRSPLVGAMRFSRLSRALLAMLAISWQSVLAQEETQRQVLEPRMVHLRNDPLREWSSFPAQAESDHLEIRFKTQNNAGPYALRLRQVDVKQRWRVLLNGQPLGDLVRHEIDQTIYLPIAAGVLKEGQNVLQIESPARLAQLADDIRVGELSIEPRALSEVVNEAALEIEVVDAGDRSPLPARITIANRSGSLQQTGAASDDRLAVRPGVVYSADGKARVGVPAGEYTVYAGRGFEYSVAQESVSLKQGETVRRTLAIRREVPTPDYVACDTHIHTVTHSGHGDATIAERMITLAGEGIELPIATDHNQHIDYQPHVERLNLARWFTPVIGNEVTTSVGHFNVFPVQPGARLPDHKQTAWPAIFDQIFATPDVKVAILNHARDIHSGTRPFGPQLFNAAIGENVAGWPMRFNAMEIINSGATQTDPLRLLHDWMALLNRGYHVTPVGSSDSHDVSRYIVGQGRTYIRAADAAPGQIGIASAIENFLAGKVLVSYGLMTTLSVAGKYQSGEVAAVTGDDIALDVHVLGPHWTQATRLEIYANGQLVIEKALEAPAANSPAGVKWQGTLTIPRPKHDVHLVAVALGPGIDAPYWPTAKPYQPTSPDWAPYVLGVSGAVWVDADGDGRRSAPRHYAESQFASAKGDPVRLIAALGDYDAAVAAQAAHLVEASGQSLQSEEVSQAVRAAPLAVQKGFAAYVEAARDTRRARATGQ